jgi:NAD(P)-dependent dehydrogenase (short-subunit alcohol dehydrogenase family)
MSQTAGLQGKKVVVLGGTSGIGLSVAQAAAREGASVVVASSSREKVAAAVATLGGKGEGYACDFSDEAQVRGLAGRIGALDHLVYTAGESLILGAATELDLATVRKAFGVRLFGAMTAVKYAAPHIRPGGSVVLTHGIAGRRPNKGWTVGSSICGAMESYTRALAMDLAPIRVNAVSPGFVRTPLWANIPEADREALFAKVGAGLPVGRVGESDEIAETYLYLMKNGFSSGQTIIVDGGGVLV